VALRDVECTAAARVLALSLATKMPSNTAYEAVMPSKNVATSKN
jgi:hypothetical protein